MIVSTAALTVSVSVAAWNVLSFFFIGARVRVRMEVGLLSEGGLAAYRYRRGLPDPEHTLIDRDKLHLEVALLRVENAGRTAVTVRGAAFDLGAEWSWRRLKWERHTVQTVFLKFNDSHIASVIRLEPFDYAEFILDLDGVIAAAETAGVHDLRGSIAVAGKRWRRRSSWRERWVIEPSKRVLGDPPTVETVVFRELMRRQHAGPEVDRSWLPKFHAQRFARDWQDGEPDPMRVASLLSDLDSEDHPGRSIGVAFAVMHDLHRHGLVPSSTAPTQTVSAQSPRPDLGQRAGSEVPPPESSGPSDP